VADVDDHATADLDDSTVAGTDNGQANNVESSSDIDLTETI